MIFIDDDEWPPSLHRTGSEDYFNHAWGMQDNAFLMNGSALHESIVPGYQVSYRFHLVDPIHFSKRIAVTFEHGHANHLSDDWSSTGFAVDRLINAQGDGQSLIGRPTKLDCPLVLRASVEKRPPSANSDHVKQKAWIQTQTQGPPRSLFSQLHRLGKIDKIQSRDSANDISLSFDES